MNPHWFVEFWCISRFDVEVKANKVNGEIQITPLKNRKEKKSSSRYTLHINRRLAQQ